MIFIHHHRGDSEREEEPPERIRHVARRAIEQGSVFLDRNSRLFVSASNPRINQVWTMPTNCGSDYWELVIEDTDL